MGAFEKFLGKLRALVDDLLGQQERAWDGSASNYDSTESYCSACLIDLNSAAGNEEKAQAYCKLPVKSPGSDSYNFEGIQAAAGALAGARTELSKPDGVSDDAWDSAVKSAANTVIEQYNANDETAPDSVYEAAGKEPPKEDAMQGDEQAEDEEEDRAASFMSLSSAVDYQLFEREDWPWLHGMYVEDDGSLFGVASTGGKLYRFSVTQEGGDIVLGEFEQVVEDFKPVAARTRTSVFRDAGGAWRWLSISCSAVLNRVGEIDSRALFDSFVTHAEETGEYPYRTFYHCGEALRYGQADFLARDDYLYITSGIFDIDGENGDLALAEIEARQKDPDGWGESIGYVPSAPPELVEVSEGVSVPVFNAGINREISALPASDAAALFTYTTTEEVSRMNDKIKNALRALGIGDERVDELEQQVDGTNRAVGNEGLIARDAGGDAEPVEEPEGDEPEGEEPTEIVVEFDEDELVESVADRVMERLVEPLATITEIVEAIEALRDDAEKARGLLDERVKALERDEDDKRREWQEDLPRRQRATVTYRPREAHKDDNDDKPPTYAEKAQATLDNIPAAY